LSYNSAVLSYVKSMHGDFLGFTGRAVVCPDAALTGGITQVACASTGAESGPTGDGGLIIFTFQAVGSGNGTLTLNLATGHFYRRVRGGPAAVRRRQ